MVLLDRRAKEAMRIERLRSGIACHKKIPPEVLSFIFIYTVSDRPAHILWNRQECPWNIIQVCSRWRALALSDARLWKTMILKVPNVAYQDVFTPTPPSFIKPHQSHQSMEHLYIKIPCMSFALESILSPFSRCENLKGVRFSADYPSMLFVHDKSFLTRFPWARLTILAFINCEFHPSDVAELVRQTVNLVTLQVMIEWEPAHNAPIPAVEMDRLRSLELNGYSQAIETVINFLTLPSLETLALIGRPPLFPREHSFQETTHLINRSRCSIKHLVVRSLPSVEGGIELCLPLVPELLSLEFSSSYRRISSDTLNRMRQEELVPNLETFSGNIASLDAFCALLQARYEGVPPRKNRRMRNISIEVETSEYERRKEEIVAFVEHNRNEGRKFELWREGFRYTPEN